MGQQEIGEKRQEIEANFGRTVSPGRIGSPERTMSPGWHIHSGVRNPSPDSLEHRNVRLPGDNSGGRARVRQASKDYQENMRGQTSPSPASKQSQAGKWRNPPATHHRSMPWENKVDIGPKGGNLNRPASMKPGRTETESLLLTEHPPATTNYSELVMRHSHYDAASQAHQECMEVPPSVFFHPDDSQIQDAEFSFMIPKAGTAWEVSGNEGPKMPNSVYRGDVAADDSQLLGMLGMLESVEPANPDRRF